MAATPLSVDQQTAVDGLVAGGRLEVVPVDEARAYAFLHQVSEALADLPNVTRPQNRYNLAYDACHDVGEALLAAYGYRTTNGSGQHEALGRYLKASKAKASSTTRPRWCSFGEFFVMTRGTAQ